MHFSVALLITMAATVLAISTTYTVRDDYQQVESRGEEDGVLIGSSGGLLGT